VSNSLKNSSREVEVHVVHYEIAVGRTTDSVVMLMSIQWGNLCFYMV